MNAPTFPCPVCQKQLPQSGIVECDGETLPTYQCDTCTVLRQFCGEPFKAALTFCVRAGRAFDPAAPDEAGDPWAS